MSQPSKIKITPEHALIVQTILAKYLPAKSSVFVFGSRAKGKIKPHSDLDVAVNINGQELSVAVLAHLKDAFDESLLPYKVDIVDLNSIDDEFKKAIEVDCVKFVFGH
ncbi:MAG: nucleotidyltransferase domain-containing protein [Gammaproteobacteria bacterium]|nr:nucleotidyltransferase domain-containing protein [Gammaproteobacteria bacterium]